MRSNHREWVVKDITKDSFQNPQDAHFIRPHKEVLALIIKITALFTSAGTNE